ncbi:hypothetical protein [Xanthomonas arboricola]|uniref:hypothetical protein n=1 Tax=Xanthomonas arboricola TaxID=56448 RepID=UPI00128F7545|nr:hypothetical protein [Xanthomonas arboricola]
MADLIDLIEHRIRGCAKRNRRNYYAASFLLTMAVGTSALTAIAVALDQMPKSVIAALASLPGIFVLVNTTFRFEERSRWYWRKRTRLEVVCRQHKFQGLSKEDASKKWNEIDEEMFGEWPGLGAGQIGSAPGNLRGKG